MSKIPLQSPSLMDLTMRPLSLPEPTDQILFGQLASNFQPLKMESAPWLNANLAIRERLASCDDL
jgi:hypothetical protein